MEERKEKTELVKGTVSSFLSVFCTKHILPVNEKQIKEGYNNYNQSSFVKLYNQNS